MEFQASWSQEGWQGLIHALTHARMHAASEVGCDSMPLSGKGRAGSSHIREKTEDVSRPVHHSFAPFSFAPSPMDASWAPSTRRHCPRSLNGRLVRADA